MKANLLLSPLPILCLSLFTLQCTRSVPDTRAVDEAAIRQADMSWSKTVETKQLDAFAAYVLEDAVMLGPNAPITTGKQAIRDMFASEFALPGYAAKWQPVKVEAARSGDLGYSRGTYEFTVNDPKGNPITDHGKYATVWKKRADGTWKVAVDMFNSDLPAPSSK
jgi:ketosteroid isomerase-like protein